MASTLPKESSMIPYPRTFLSIIALVVGLTMFLFLASSLLVSQPIGFTVRNYYYGVASSQRIDLVASMNDSVVDTAVDKVEIEGQRDSTELDKSEASYLKGGNWRSDGEGDDGKEIPGSDSVEEDKSSESEQGKKIELDKSEANDLKGGNWRSDGDGWRGDIGKEIPDSVSAEEDKSSKSEQGKKRDKPSEVDTLQNSTANTIDQHATKESNGNSSGGPVEAVGKKHQVPKSPENNGSSESGQGKDSLHSPSNDASQISTTATYVKDESHVSISGGIGNTTSSSEHTKKLETDSINSECDLYHGKWVFDIAGPLYSNNSCPVLSQMQNCQGNGRPDKDYENWRWKPNQCDLPRFNPRKFLELMRGKTLAFIGDSVARNQMESMLCILWQAEEPKNRGNKRMQRYFFRSTSTMIVRIWSSWLVHQTTEPFDYAPAGVTKLHLDAPDEGFMEYIKEFDVIVISSGHWFAKQSVYILNNEIVGGQLWWPHKSKKMKVNNVKAFEISVETIFSSMVSDANYSGLTIVRSFSPDHYEGGAWNTGGSCTGKVKPATDSELVESGFTNTMHEKQESGFNRAIKKQTNKSTLKLMDITPMFSYRHDGHPGPYRSTDPNKKTKRGPDGKPPPQDCLHWCMPGPVDTWNELVFEIIRQEFKRKEASLLPAASSAYHLVSLFMELSKTMKYHICCPPYFHNNSRRRKHRVCLLSMNGCHGDTNAPIGTIETRTLPSVLTPALAMDSLSSAIFEMKCNPPPFASGIIRLEVPVQQKIDAIEWLNSQNHHLLPRCFFSGRTQTIDNDTVSYIDYSNGNGNGKSMSAQVKLVSFAGIGSAVFFRHLHPFSLNDWRAIRRFLSKKCPLLRAYGAIRFDATSEIGSEWEPFGSFYFMIPQVELDELDKSSIIAATVAWDNALFWTYRKAIAALEVTMSQISSIIIGSHDLFPYTFKDRITHVPNRKSWDSSVCQALQMINQQDSTLSKVVLARRSQILTTTDMNPLTWLARFKVDGGNAYQFCLQPPESSAFIGNTPENLFHRSELKIFSEALAGTRARGRTESLDLQIGYELLSSCKDHHEFTIVRECIRRKLEDICSCVSIKPMKALRRLPRIQHLYACLTGTLQSEDDEFQILTSLHPTPAVCGFPMEEARILIEKTEKFDRGMYAGPIGWFGGRESEFAVGIRSALVDKGHGALIYAGTGIVEGSDSYLEWEELDLKNSQFMKLMREDEVCQTSTMVS